MKGPLGPPREPGPRTAVRLSHPRQGIPGIPGFPGIPSVTSHADIQPHQWRTEVTGITGRRITPTQVTGGITGRSTRITHTTHCTGTPTAATVPRPRRMADRAPQVKKATAFPG